MHLTEGEIYHVFNRGNNKQKIFFKPENYSYFLKGIERYLIPYCDLLAWCLMPNHFHMLIHANSSSTPIIKDGSFERQQFSQGIKQLLSSYTKAINKQEGRTGSLFQQKTKALCVTDDEKYDTTAFHYIHQNPMKARLVARMEHWEYSSFKDYLGLRKETLCNMNLTKERLEINFDKLYEEAYQVINFEFDD
jgi:putative transposase